MLETSRKLAKTEHWSNIWSHEGQKQAILRFFKAEFIPRRFFELTTLYLNTLIGHDADTIIRELQKIYDLMQPNQANAPTLQEAPDIFSPIVRLALWPYVLAGAIALRITKVTAELTPPVQRQLSWPVCDN
jgi:hypothetical protein